MKVEFDLMSNAIDSIERAMELVAWGDEQGDARRLKQAVQAVAHGIELLLKERLRRIHPVLLWENVDKYPSLTSRTVTSEGAMSRLINIGGLTFSKEDIEIVRSLRATRNAIEHYAWTTTKPEAEHIVGVALAFAIDFSEKQLRHGFFGYHTRKDDTLPCLLQSNSAFAKALANRKKPVVPAALESAKECAFCRAVAFDPETGACRICGHWGSTDQEDDEIPF